MQADAIPPTARAVVLAGMLALSGGALAAGPAPAGAGATSPLERRVALLARELDLDAAQKFKLRSLLEGQREQVVRVWQDESVPGALRVARTQAISERTEDAIRAVLTDAQRQKYFKPRPDRGAIGGTPDDLATYVDKINRR